MRFKLTIVLLLANLAVFFILWRLEQPVERMPTPAGPVPRDFDPDHVIIENKVSHEIRELVRDRIGNWRIVKPVDWPANDYAINPMITDLQLIEAPTPFSADDLAKSGESLSSYGLENPELEVTLQSGKSKTVTLEIGGHTPNGNSIYLMNKADRLISAVDPESLARLVTPLKDLRDNRIFSLPIFDIQGLSVRTLPAAGPAATQDIPQRVTLVKDGDQWRLDTPVVSPADTGLVDQVVGQLDNLNAVDFLSPTDAAGAHTGLDSPFMRIDLKGESTQTLLLGDHVPSAPEERYAKLDSSPTIFTVNAAQEPFKTLLNAQQVLRERQFLNFAGDKVSTITLVDSAGGELRLQKLETGTSPWQILKDASGATVPITADSDQVKGLLDSLSGLSATSFTSDAAGPDDLHHFGLDAPRWKVKLQADKAITINFGTLVDKDTTRYYANVEGSLSVYEIDAIPHFSTNALEYRNRVLEAQPEGTQVVSFKLTRLSATQPEGEVLDNYTLDPQKTNWDQLLKDKTEGEREAIIHLGESAKQFRVDSYLPLPNHALSFAEPYETTVDSTGGATTPVPWVYRLEVGVLLPAVGKDAGQNLTLTFYFSGALTPSRQIGGTSDPLPTAVFVLPQDIIGDLRGLTHELNQPAETAKVLQEATQPIDTRPPAIAPADTSATPTPATPEPAAPASTAPVSPAPVAPAATAP